MATRDFEQWLSTFTDTVATWGYYTDFEKVYNHVDAMKIELNILNSLIGSKNIEEEFKTILTRYPETLKCIPILLAKREKEIIIKSPEKDYYYNFKKMNYTIDEYCLFMRKNGLFDLLENHIINNLYDYVTGVEVGLDTNARKNRTGDTMEDLVESFIQEAGFIKDVNYFSQFSKSKIEEKWGMDLSKISNDGTTEKVFDFVVKTENQVYAIEANFYSGGGSKLNETARSYKTITLEADEIDGLTFVWFTDGQGWKTAKRNLQETFDVLEDVYNINDLKNGIMSKIFGEFQFKKELIDEYKEAHSGFGAGAGDVERYEYKCPCGKGTIVEEHDNIPGFREHDVYICCEECNKKYKIDTANGVRGWTIIKK